MNISILASIGAHNLGDELILKNEISLLKQEFGLNSNFRVFSYDVKQPFFTDPHLDYREYFPIDIRNPKKIIRNLVNYFSFVGTLLWSDIVVIGGGGIFYDNELQSNKNPLDLWLFRVKMAKLLRKKIYFYAVSIDIHNHENNYKIKEIFQSAYKITVRNDNTQDLLARLDIDSQLVDDPVMYDNAGELPDESSLVKALYSRDFDMQDVCGIDFSSKTVGLALRKGYFSKSGSEKIELAMIQEIVNYVSSQGAKVILLPHSFHPNDEVANDHTFLSQLKGYHVITTSMQETYMYYTQQKLDIVFAQRLHSMILSEVYNIPYVALSYSKKTHGQLKKLSR